MARRGAPKGNINHLTHGLALVRNQIKRRVRRGRSYVDQRTHEGREALRIQAGLVDDQGGIDALSSAQFVAIQELTNLYYLASMMDHQTARFLQKNPTYKNPKALARLFSYRAPVSGMIAKYLDLLGLDKKPPPQKSLEDLLAEDEPGESEERDESEADER